MPLFVLEESLNMTQPNVSRLGNSKKTDLMDVFNTTSDANTTGVTAARESNLHIGLVRFGGRRSSKASSSKNTQSMRNSNMVSPPGRLDHSSGYYTRPMTTQTTSAQKQSLNKPVLLSVKNKVYGNAVYAGGSERSSIDNYK